MKKKYYLIVPLFLIIFSCGGIGLTGFSYPESSYVLYINEDVVIELLEPLSGEVQFFSIPALPEGLLLHTATGVISGTPELESDKKDYIITAENQFGQAETALELTVLAQIVEQPDIDSGTIVLSEESKSFEIGTSVYIYVMSGTVGVTSFSISPVLPQGLEFNITSGDITGYATEPATLKVYTVTGHGSDIIRIAEVEIEATSTQPDGFREVNGYWVEPVGDDYICGLSSDCGGELNCEADRPGGMCTGCDASNPCPSGFTCLAGYCLKSCTGNSDCSDGQVCNNGYCGLKTCLTNSDCGDNYFCRRSDPGDPEGSCYRKPVEQD